MDSKRFKSVLDTAASLLTILVCIAAAAVMWRWYQTSVSAVRKSPNPIFRPGERVTEIDIDNQFSGTLVLAVRSSCHYCTSSMPLIRRLVKSEVVRDRRIKLVAVSTETKEVLRTYLKFHGVEVDGVHQVDGKARLARYTPYTAVLDRHGTVVGSWVGQLGEASLQEILAEIIALGG